MSCPAGLSICAVRPRAPGGVDGDSYRELMTTHPDQCTSAHQGAAAAGQTVEREVDEFDLPAVLFGPPPDWFYPAVGRVVAVCALLENKAQVLAETLTGVQQNTLTMARLSDLKKQALHAARAIDARNAGGAADPLTPGTTEFFVRTELVLARRHGIVHAVWPAQPGEQQFGWRPGRREDGGQARVTADNTRAGLTDLIRQASQLILGWPGLHGAASHARLRAFGA